MTFLRSCLTIQRTPTSQMLALLRRFVPTSHLVQTRRNKKTNSSSQGVSRFVLVSQSDDIFENLALEEWLYENQDLQHTDLLLMWRNRPTVVCGRHQNVWMEANVPFVKEAGIQLARRASGGGAVYHDEGNLNLSFLKSRDRYNRKQNLELVAQALRMRWNLDLHVNKRDDILLENFFKVSGTAAKLGRLQSYHHFTLLCWADTDRLHRSLHSPLQDIDTKSTKSCPSTVMNLKERAPDMTFELLTETVGRHFLEEIGSELNSNTFKLVNPRNEQQYPGVSDTVRRLVSWDWLYGKTPKFAVRKNFSLPVLDELSILRFQMEVEKGHVVSVSAELDYRSKMADELNGRIREFFDDFMTGDTRLTTENVARLLDSFEEEIVCALQAESVREKEDATSIAGRVLVCLKSVLNFL